MDRAIVVSQQGGPEVLEWTQKDPGELGPGEVLVRHTAVGLNFIDVYHRTGLYPLEPPFTPGVEGAGIVAEVGEGVTELSTGDRVAYTGNGPIGSYCEGRVLPSSRLYKLPDEISNDTAAAIMLKGCTVEYLVRRTYPVSSGDWVLLHAAAGGGGGVLIVDLDPAAHATLLRVAATHDMGRWAAAKAKGLGAAGAGNAQDDPLAYLRYANRDWEPSAPPPKTEVVLGNCCGQPSALPLPGTQHHRCEQRSPARNDAYKRSYSPKRARSGAPV